MGKVSRLFRPCHAGFSKCRIGKRGEGVAAAVPKYKSSWDSRFERRNGMREKI